MRIATWNLKRCPPGPSDRGDRLRKVILGVEADVWVLTESFLAFAPGPGYRLLSCSASAQDRKAAQGECWVAIWARAGLPAERMCVEADVERSAAVRLNGPVSGGTVVVGMVLPWLTDDRDTILRGGAAFQARLTEQAADWQRLQAAAGGRICVAGDFNQDLLIEGHYYGSTGGRLALRKTLAELNLDCLTAGTDDPLGNSPKLASIDHICIGSGLWASRQPPSTAWPASEDQLKGVTDHHGVWADIEPIGT